MNKQKIPGLITRDVHVSHEYIHSVTFHKMPGGLAAAVVAFPDGTGLKNYFFRQQVSGNPVANEFFMRLELVRDLLSATNQEAVQLFGVQAHHNESNSRCIR